ncbi:ABC transporter permease [Oceanobacillus saliphilus]|uniref:ABC transporter permease n=1 Tax=Oceanobacillus saliphilus TaxID=2925834 RepID=UPI00201DF0BD|nr:ABC transporter permease subunit [Oceanobacillus saliphilus]
MLRNIYIKEMKDSFRDRRTLLLTVFLPIIMMSVLTIFYESLISTDEGQTFTLAIESSISVEEESLLTDYANIEIVKADDPAAIVREGEAQAALLLSPSFFTRIENGENASVTLIGDSFSQNSSTLMGIVTNILTSFEKTIITERLIAQGTDPSIIEPFTIEQQESSGENPNVNLLAMLIPLILALAIGIGASPAAADLFAGEKEKKTMEALLMTPVNRTTMLFAKWLTITSIGSIIGIITLIVVALEIAFFTEHLKAAVSFNNQAGMIIGIAVAISIVYAMFCASLLMLTSIIGKTVKEAQSYSTPVMMLSMFPVMFLSSVGINELAFEHFAIPILNLFSLLKELLFGVVDYQHVFITIGSNLICIIIIFIIGRILFKKDKWVMN